MKAAKIVTKQEQLRRQCVRCLKRPVRGEAFIEMKYGYIRHAHDCTPAVAPLADPLEIFSLDHVLPTQFHARDQKWSPQQRLLAAVLSQAIDTARLYRWQHGRHARRVQEELAAWFASNDTSYLFSFTNCCSYLGFDPDYIRQGLAKMYERDSGPPTKMRLTDHRQGVIA